MEKRADRPGSTDRLAGRLPTRYRPLPEEETLGIREEDWPATPEAMADWLNWYDSLEPLEITAAEEVEFAAWRRRVKESSIGTTQERIARLFE